MQRGRGIERRLQSGRLVSQAVLSPTPKLGCNCIHSSPNGLVSIHLLMTLCPFISLELLSMWSPGAPTGSVRSKLSSHSRTLSALLPSVDIGTDGTKVAVGNMNYFEKQHQATVVIITFSPPCWQCVSHKNMLTKQHRLLNLSPHCTSSQ